MKLSSQLHQPLLLLLLLSLSLFLFAILATIYPRFENPDTSKVRKGEACRLFREQTPLSSSPLLYPTAQRRASVVGSATNRITNSRHNKKSRFQSVARPRFVPCLFGQMPRPDYPVALHLATFNVGQAGLARLQID